MDTLEQALHDVRTLHEQVTRAPAPDIGPQAFMPFPPGVDPVAFAVHEVAELKRLCQSQAGPGPQPCWMPRADVYAGESGLSLVVEIPGVARDNVAVIAMAGGLVVRGTRSRPPVDESLRPMLVEQACGAFERWFALPAWCDPEQVRARYSHGILEIQVGRRNHDGPQEFRVEVA
jgi:HSP20 family protein